MSNRPSSHVLEPARKDRIARRFFTRFDRHRKRLEGCLDWGDERGRGVTALLNRLMLLHFLQASGLLPEGDRYLANRLAEWKESRPGRFYRELLLPLCFVGFGAPAGGRGGFEELLRGVPYLGSELFRISEVEARLGVTREAVAGGTLPPGIQVPDEELEQWLTFFGSWRWTLSEKAPPQEGQLDPGILGYLLERYVDRRELGAYYTREDITGYICRNTIIPRWFDLLAETGEAVDPLSICQGGGIDRYVYEAVKTPDYLPGETDGEHAARGERYAALLRDFEAGKIRSLDDAITYNLDLERLALDFLETMEDPECLWRCYEHGLKRLTILDPAVGSGAFLLAATDLLLPLYRTALHRMEVLCAADAPPSPVRDRMRAELAHGLDDFPSLEYYACRMILEHNLFGVDLLEEAAEVCKLRLFLKLIAHAGAGAGGGAGALPDLGARIRVGNSLVGLVRPEEAGWTLPEPPRPFHWCAELPEPLAAGGFDAIIGNPPYVECSGAPPGLPTQYSARYANQYAYFLERSYQLLRWGARLGMIVPVSCVAGAGYRPLMDRLRSGSLWLSSFSNRPAKLFEGVEQRLTIVLAHASGPAVTYCAGYQHWYAEERPTLFTRLQYVEASTWAVSGMPIKSGSPSAERIFAKLTRHQGRLELAPDGEQCVWLHDGPTYWVRALPFEPNPGRPGPRGNHYHALRFRDEEDALIAAVVLSSSTFYFFFKMVSNCRDLGRREWSGFPIDPLPEPRRLRLRELGGELRERLRSTAAVRTRVYPSGAITYREYYPASARDLLDQADAVLAEHYALDPDEARYVREYDLKYRLGLDSAFR